MRCCDEETLRNRWPERRKFIWSAATCRRFSVGAPGDRQPRDSAKQLMRKRRPVAALQGLWNLTRIIGSIDELFTAGRRPIDDHCLGSGRIQRWSWRAGESFEGHLGMIVAANDPKKGDANVFLHGQLQRVASFSIGR